MSKSILVGPGMTVEQAVKEAGYSVASFFPAPKRARRSDVRPQGRQSTKDCPGCAVESMEMLRRVVGFGGAGICGSCHREARR